MHAVVLSAPIVGVSDEVKDHVVEDETAGRGGDDAGRFALRKVADAVAGAGEGIEVAALLAGVGCIGVGRFGR